MELEMKEHFASFMRTLRGACLLLLSGIAAGAYLDHQYIFAPMKQDVANGWCGKLDHRGRYFEFACQDAFIAASLAQHDVEQDQIGALIQAEDEKPRVKKRK
jgi:hypothetical protein